jgi:hypothetical protein
MGSLVFAIEFAKKLCYKEDSWDGRISNFSILLFRYLLFMQIDEEEFRCEILA